MDPDAFLCQLATVFSGVTVNSFSFFAEIALLSAILLLFVLGFISASEIAFFSLSTSDLNSLGLRNNLSDRNIHFLLEKSDRLLATIHVTKMFVNIAIIMLCNAFFLEVFDTGNSTWTGVLIFTFALTFVLLLFGEIISKIYSAQRTLSFCRFAAPIITVLGYLFLPIVLILIRSNTYTNKYLARKSYGLSVDELSHALELTDKEDLSDEKQILEGIIRFGGETAKEIMTSRLDVVDLSIKASYKEVLQCIIENVYSRIPVYSGSRDNIKGILYIKDLLPHLNKADNFRWQSLIRPAYFVPETKMIDDLLRDFQANKIHIAIVVDEFGGTSGIVTMEDILEEIVGEIRDEYDEEENTFVKLNDNSYIFEAKTQLTDFYKIANINNVAFEQIAGDADTLAGLLLEIKGEFPALHEVISYNGYDFEVLKMDERRILKVKFTIHEEAADL
nr:gliding motility-associated protein GldE [uncultured Bacteroides sp.]